MSYTHLYGGWMPRNPNYRGTVVHTLVNEEERPELTFEDDGILKDKSMTVHLQLLATFDHDPTEREMHDALPQLFRSTMSDGDMDLGDDWDDEPEEDDEGDVEDWTEDDDAYRSAG